MVRLVPPFRDVLVDNNSTRSVAPAVVTSNCVENFCKVFPSPDHLFNDTLYAACLNTPHIVPRLKTFLETQERLHGPLTPGFWLVVFYFFVFFWGGGVEVSVSLTRAPFLFPIRMEIGRKVLGEHVESSSNEDFDQKDPRKRQERPPSVPAGSSLHFVESRRGNAENSVTAVWI